MTRLQELETRKKILIEYMQEKIKEADWHGVSDAANDLRELEIELKYVDRSGVMVSFY